MRSALAITAADLFGLLRLRWPDPGLRFPTAASPGPISKAEIGPERYRAPTASSLLTVSISARAVG